MSRHGLLGATPLWLHAAYCDARRYTVGPEGPGPEMAALTAPALPRMTAALKADRIAILVRARKMHDLSGMAPIQNEILSQGHEAFRQDSKELFLESFALPLDEAGKFVLDEINLGELYLQPTGDFPGRDFFEDVQVKDLIVSKLFRMSPCWTL
jgi:hypothetical protein